MPDTVMVTYGWGLTRIKVVPMPDTVMVVYGGGLTRIRVVPMPDTVMVVYGWGLTKIRVVPMRDTMVTMMEPPPLLLYFCSLVEPPIRSRIQAMKKRVISVSRIQAGQTKNRVRIR